MKELNSILMIYIQIIDFFEYRFFGMQLVYEPFLKVFFSERHFSTDVNLGHEY